jgi:hypothetical protein
MNAIEISQLIATEVKRWTHIDGVAYSDEAGNIWYLPNYPDSIAHALDLAMAEKVSLIPQPNSTWSAATQTEALAAVSANDANVGMAICLAVLAKYDIAI